MKKTPIVILSLFDGISCGQAALKKLLPKGREYVYYACEIEKGAMKITMYNFPGTIQLGDVRNLTRDMIPYEVLIVMGGSPCQCFSFAGKQKGMTIRETDIQITSLKEYLRYKDAGFEFEGESYLYWEFVRVVEMFKPKYFLLENVVMSKEWKDIVSGGLGVTPIRINSSLVSAQNRDRLYWTNIPGVEVPEDRKIYLADITLIPGTTGYGIRNEFIGNYHPNGRKKYDYRRKDIRRDGKANCLTCGETPTTLYILPDGSIHKYTINEMEVLQTLEKGYTDVPGLAKCHKIKGIGNGWTVDVIVELFKKIPQLNGTE